MIRAEACGSIFAWPFALDEPSSGSELPSTLSLPPSCALIANRRTDALADPYRIERELGHGVMATVYLATDLGAANTLVDQGYLLARDVAVVVERATAHCDWATGGSER